VNWDEIKKPAGFLNLKKYKNNIEKFGVDSTVAKP